MAAPRTRRIVRFPIQMNVRLDPVLRAELWRAERETGIKQSVLVRDLLREGLRVRDRGAAPGSAEAPVGARAGP